MKKDFEENKRKFIASIENATKCGNNNMIALKISALGCFSTLKSLNKIQISFTEIFEQILKPIDNDQYISLESLINCLQIKFPNKTREDLKNFCSKFFQLGNENKITKTMFKIKSHLFLIDQQKRKELSANAIFNDLYKLSEEEKSKLLELAQRLDEILIHAAAKKVYSNSISKKTLINFKQSRVLIDAEQSYVQVAMNSIAEQFQLKYYLFN